MPDFFIRLLCALFCLALSTSLVVAAPGLPDFEPDPDLTSPAEFLGFEVGEWHPRHDQITAYLAYLAEASDRVSIEQIGQTHGLRPLTLVTFTSPERMADIDRIRADRVRASRAGEGPPVIWLGYSIHGNEPSGASAALAMAWYLAAADNDQVRRWLDEAVIVMEPVLNPDGLDRFAHWVNMNRGMNRNPDPADMEHHETWPNGRTNYYWFDLNRDWLPLAHPESRARLAHYHLWRPHVLTDHHEMGTNSTYFFQPGVPERNNPLTPDRNFELTADLAAYHGRLLDEAGEPYYTRETFDDYYLGKGSTYPDLTGGVGILFEQASSRGHRQDSVYGERRFADTVANQVRTSISTVEGGVDLAEELIAYQADFFASARREATGARDAGWVFGDDGDPARGRALVELLLQHDISVLPVRDDVTVAGRLQPSGTAWAVPADQDQYRFLRSVFEPVTELPMETFYDVSTWPLAMSFDLPLESVRRLPAAGDALEAVEPVSAPAPADDAVAWVVPWDQRQAAPLLGALLADDYKVQVLTRPTRLKVDDDAEQDFVRGSLIVHRGLQPASASPVAERLVELGAEHGVSVHAVRSGLAISGSDLGAPSAPLVDPLRPALLVGRGMRATNAGYIWHWFDHYLQQPLTRLDWQRLARTDLGDYTHLILPDGNYSVLPDGAAAQLADFVREGGVLMAARRASAWVESLPLDWDLIDAEPANTDNGEVPERRPYEAFELDRARELIGGSALGIRLDVSHPLGFGYTREEMAVMRRGRHVLRPAGNAYSSVAVYTDEVVKSGYLGDHNRERLAGTPALSLTRHGRGAVVRMADDYLFRGYWPGTERLFANALYFSRIVGPTRLPSAEE